MSFDREDGFAGPDRDDDAGGDTKRNKDVTSTWEIVGLSNSTAYPAGNAKKPTAIRMARVRGYQWGYWAFSAIITY
jgi:hypothetical protein